MFQTVCQLLRKTRYDDDDDFLVFLVLLPRRIEYSPLGGSPNVQYRYGTTATRTTSDLFR